MNLIALAFRNLVRQKRRTSILVAAVAIGFAVVALLLGLSGGLVANLKNNLSHTYGGHVFLKAEEWNSYGKVVTRITRDDQVRTALAAIAPAVQSSSRRSTVESTLVFGSKTDRASLVGVELEQEADFLKNLSVVSGTLPARLEGTQVLLNAQTATKLGVTAGEGLLVKFKTLDGQQNVLDLQVAAIVQTSGAGSFTVESYLPLAMANQMLGLAPDAYQSLNVYLNDLNQQVPVALQLEQALAAEGNVKFRQAPSADANPLQAMIDKMLGEDTDNSTWTGPRYSVSILDDFTSTFMTLIGAIQAVALVVFLIVLAVLVIGISNTFRMILQERTVEIGTLRALGLRRRGIRQLFLWEAFAVITVGLVSGGVLATLIGLLLSAPSMGTDTMVSTFLSQGHLSLRPDLAPLIVAVLFVLGAGLLAAWGPARKASNLFPADALRHRG